jgi:hypothetical protein
MCFKSFLFLRNVLFKVNGIVICVLCKVCMCMHKSVTINCHNLGTYCSGHLQLKTSHQHGSIL